MSSKKEKGVKQPSLDKVKAMREAYAKQAQIYKERVQPLVRFLRKNSLRFTNAHVGNERVEYFRLDEFEKLVEEKSESIKKDEKLDGLIKGAQNEFMFFKRPDTVKIKYPKTLEPVPPNHPERKYASFRFDTTESNKGMTILLICIVLGVVLFPIWPYEVKYGIWLVSLFLLIVLVGIIVIRLVLFLLIAIFNYNVWIFPNLFYSNGILDSFIPVIEVSKGERSWFNIFLRLFALSLFILLSVHVYLNPTFIDENIQMTKQTINDVHDWGVAKLKKEGNFSQRALTNLDKILNETADVSQEIKTEESSNEIENEDHTNFENQQVQQQVQNIQENSIELGQNVQGQQSKDQIIQQI